MPIHTRNCDHCGREYSRRRESELGKYCSRDCASISRRKDVAARCEQCGGEFSYRAGRKVRRFCSKACAADSLRRQVEHTCDRCGAVFTRVPTQAGKYCSKECAYAARRKDDPAHRRMLNAPGHPLAFNSPYIPEHRAILYERIGPGTHHCHHCRQPVTWRPGGGTGKGVLVVDHLDRDPMNNSDENLAPSCTRCNVLNADRTIGDQESFRVLASGVRVRGDARKCEHCGGDFVTWTKNPGRGRGRFCSRSCARKAQWVSRWC